MSMVVSMLWWHFGQCRAESHLWTIFFTENQTCRVRLLTVLDIKVTYPTTPSVLHEIEVALWEQGIVQSIKTTKNFKLLLLQIVSPLDILDIFTGKNKKTKVETSMCFICLFWYLWFFHVREENLCLTGHMYLKAKQGCLIRKRSVMASEIYED